MFFFFNFHPLLFVLSENKNAGVLYQLESSSLPLKQLQDQLLNDCKLDIRLLKLFDEWKVLSGSDFDICVVLLKQFELLYSIRPPRQEDPVTEFIVPLFLREDFWGAKARRIAPKKQRAAWAKSIRKSFWKSSIKRSHRYVFYVFLPDGLFLRLVSRCYRLATYVSVSEHLLEAEVKYKDGEKIMIELRETRSKDGTGSIGITCLTSKATKLLDSVFTRFTDELKALIADSYKVLPYEELVETKNKDLVRTADIIKEESNVKTYRVVQRQGSIILDLESKTLSLASILEDVSPDAIVKVKGTYLFKKLLRQRVREDLMLRLDSEPIQVRDNLMVGLKSIYKRIGVSVGDHSFLNPNDDFVKTLELSLKKLYNSPSELNSLGQIILRLENRIRTDFDGFLSHSWGDANQTHNWVLKLDKYLRDTYGINCWMDHNMMEPSGNIIGDMSSGIGNSHTFLVCITNDYCDKVDMHFNKVKTMNCGREYFYAAQNKEDWHHIGHNLLPQS